MGRQSPHDVGGEALPHDTCMGILRQEAGKGWWDRDVVEMLDRCRKSEPRAAQG